MSDNRFLEVLTEEETALLKAGGGEELRREHVMMLYNVVQKLLNQGPYLGKCPP